MKISQKKLLKLRNQVDKKMINEGFFDDIKSSYQRQKANQEADVAEYRQRRLEMDRLEYVKSGRPIPAHLTKSALRRYYTDPNAVPDFLQGAENDPTPERRYTAGRKASDIEDRVKEKSADFIGNALGLHPKAKDDLEGVMKAASVTGIASAAAAAYNWYRNTFGSDAARRALPNIESAAEDAARSPSSGASSRTAPASTVPGVIGSISMVAGVPAEKEMKYVYIPDIASKFDEVYPSRRGEDIDESKIQTMIDGPISDIVFGTGRNRINSSIKSHKWSVISQNIKKDSINDKRGLGYLAGHYYIVNNRTGGRNRYVLMPFRELASHYTNFNISELE